MQADRSRVPERAGACFAGAVTSVLRVLTDRGSCYRAPSFAAALRRSPTSALAVPDADRVAESPVFLHSTNSTADTLEYEALHP